MVRYRPLHFNLSPWVRAVAGDTSDLRLPSGYLISGLAGSGAGPWTLKLHQDGVAEPLIVDIIRKASDVEPRLRALVDMAYVNELERPRTVVTTNGAGQWIESLEDA